MRQAVQNTDLGGETGSQENSTKPPHGSRRGEGSRGKDMSAEMDRRIPPTSPPAPKCLPPCDKHFLSPSLNAEPTTGRAWSKEIGQHVLQGQLPASPLGQTHFFKITKLLGLSSCLRDTGRVRRGAGTKPRAGREGHLYLSPPPPSPSAAV